MEVVARVLELLGIAVAVLLALAISAYMFASFANLSPAIAELALRYLRPAAAILAAMFIVALVAVFTASRRV